jgi:hypothetical protein
VEFVLDFMLWSAGNVGWRVEPAWNIDARTGQIH